MPHIAVNITGQGRHWRIGFAIDGEVQPRNVFGCSEGMLPLVSGLLAAEAEANAILARAKGKVSALPTSITVGMPSGRFLTFTLTSVQQAYAVGPELSTGID